MGKLDTYTCVIQVSPVVYIVYHYLFKMLHTSEILVLYGNYIEAAQLVLKKMYMNNMKVT